MEVEFRDLGRRRLGGFAWRFWMPMAAGLAAMAAACGSSGGPRQTGPPQVAVSPTTSVPSSARTAAIAQQPSGTPRHYQVQAGDTLGIIAQRYQTTAGALQRANGLVGDTIVVGQSLDIPASPTPPAAATPGTPAADQRPARLVYGGRTDTNAVALTFDAGADVGFTALILETLKRNGVRATFGMTGQWAEDHPELVKQMAADGHEFMNHSWDHQSFTGLSTNTKPLSQPERWGQVDRTENVIRGLTGKAASPYFRSPFGDQDPSVEVDVGLRGYRYDILWTVDTGGWAKASVGQIIATSSKGAMPGAIIVMHVGAESQDGPALQSIIDGIRDKGLGFATIPELVGARP